MKTQEFIRFAGDVKLREVQVNSLNGQVANVINQVVSIEIYEDLFSPFISLTLVLRESVDYLNLFPFVGEEYLDIDIGTPSFEKSIKGRFYIYKITDREYTKDKEVIYALKAISEEFLTDANIKVSKAFGGNISENVEKLLLKEGLNTKKAYSIERTSNSTKLLSNFWSPVRCINYMTTGAVNKYGSPSYLFYENRDGFNFRSIDELLKQQTYQKLKKDNYTRNTLADGVDSIKNPEEDYKRILDFSVPVVTDYMGDVSSGRLKSRIISHDILTKKYSIKDYSLKKDEKQPTLLNPNPAYSKYATVNPSSTMMVMPKYYNNFNNFKDVTNHSSIQRRMSFFKNLEKYKVTVQVFGRTDYTVGQVFDLHVPRATQLSEKDNDTHDKILSGRYLVSAINHVISRENHICNMELVKNSVLTNLSK